MEGAIELRNVTKNYGKHRGITDVSLSVKRGDMFGFIGPNGAGKSTTIRTLLGFIRAAKGTVRLLGKALPGGLQESLKEVGYMPSEAMFYPGMRVSQVLQFSAKLSGKDCTETARELCGRLRLDTEKRVEELSLGNRKKVSIVCALQHDPMLYVLDEPTSGLDPLMQKEFYALLRERNQAGATVFLSSHVLSEIQHYCSHAAIIRDGRILVSDRVEVLAKTGARRVRITGLSSIPELAGIKAPAVEQGRVEFLYQGEMQKLLAALGGLPITDLTILEPDLEEVFWHYYEKEEE